MSRPFRRHPVLAALFGGLLTATLLAVSFEAQAEDYRRPGLPGRWVNRHLTLPMNSLEVIAGPLAAPLFGQRFTDLDGEVRVPEGGFSYVRRSDAYGIANEPEQTWLRAGVLFGLTDDWEAGALFIPLQLGPEVRFSSILAYGTRQFRFENFDLGLRLALQTPESGVWKLNPAFVLRSRLASVAALDASVTLPLSVGDQFDWGINAPVRFTTNLSPEFFLGLESGFFYAPSDTRPDATVPLGALVGLTSLVGRRVVDSTLLVSMDELIGIGGPAAISPNPSDAFRVVLGLSVHQLVK